MDCRPIGWNFIPFLARVLGLALSLIALGAEVRADEVDCVIKELQARSMGSDSDSTAQTIYKHLRPSLPESVQLAADRAMNEQTRASRYAVALRLQEELKKAGVKSTIHADRKSVGHYRLVLDVASNYGRDGKDNRFANRVVDALTQGGIPVLSTKDLLESEGVLGFASASGNGPLVVSAEGVVFRDWRREIFLGFDLLGSLKDTTNNQFVHQGTAEHELAHLDSGQQSEWTHLLPPFWSQSGSTPLRVNEQVIEIEGELLREISPLAARTLPPPGKYTIVEINPKSRQESSLADEWITPYRNNPLFELESPFASGLKKLDAEDRPKNFLRKFLDAFKSRSSEESKAKTVLLMSHGDLKRYIVNVDQLKNISSVAIRNLSSYLMVRKPGLLNGPDFEFNFEKVPSSLRPEFLKMHPEYWRGHASSEVEANLAGERSRASSEAYRVIALNEKNAARFQTNPEFTDQSRLAGFVRIHLHVLRKIVEAGPSSIRLARADPYGQIAHKWKLQFDIPSDQLKGSIELPTEGIYELWDPALTNEVMAILKRRIRALESIPIAPPAVIGIDVIVPKVDAPKLLPAPPQRPMLPPGKSK